MLRNVALDVGKGKIVACEVDTDGVLTRSTGKELYDLKRVVGPETPPARVAFEACRQGWWIHDRLLQWGHTPIMLDTTQIKRLGVGHHGRKNDEIDAETIAIELARGHVAPAHVLTESRREIRHQLAVRSAMVGSRTQYINVVRGLATAEGMRLESCAAENFVDHARNANWSKHMRDRVEPMLKVLEQLEVQLEEIQKGLLALCEAEPVITRLATVPYVGPIVAATYVSVIDDAGRFRNAHQVNAYLGLVPSENTSNQRRRLGSITKAGNHWARVMLVQAAWLMLRNGDPSDPLICWARNVEQRRNKFVAAVGLARRLASVLWAVWKNNTIYDPALLSRESCASTLAASHEVRERAQNQADAAGLDPTQLALRVAAKKLKRGLRVSAPGKKRSKRRKATRSFTISNGGDRH